MKVFRTKLIIILLLAANAGSGWSPVHAGEVKVIVHRDNPVESMSAVRLRNIYFSRHLLWLQGDKIMVVNNTGNEQVLEDFLAVIGSDKRKFSRAWIRLTLSGKSPPMAETVDDESTIAFVGRNRGAIGFVSDNARLSEKVHAVNIIGYIGSTD